MNIVDAMNPPYLTADLAGTGGRIKSVPEDFDVEEIPAYEPCGTGDHLYLWIEKRDMGAEFFVRQISKRLNLPPGEVGTAGLKDRHAVTRQWISVPAPVEANLPALEGDGIRVLRVSRHGNKLKPGHLRGNRFRILIRDADSTKAEGVATIVARLNAEGVPNFYGAQRFGKDGETVTTGLRLLRGEGGGRVSPFLRKLSLSSVQSLLFNKMLAQRMADGFFRRVLPGDVMMKWPAGGMFTAEVIAVEQERFDRRETVTGGPMFGRKTFPTHGEAAEREARCLQEAELTERSFDGFGKLMMGTRRHNLVYPDELAANWEGEGLRVTCTLPAGCYATILLREIMKAAVEDE